MDIIWKFAKVHSKLLNYSYYMWWNLLTVQFKSLNFQNKTVILSITCITFI